MCSVRRVKAKVSAWKYRALWQNQINIDCATWATISPSCYYWQTPKTHSMTRDTAAMNREIKKASWFIFVVSARAVRALGSEALSSKVLSSIPCKGGFFLVDNRPVTKPATHPVTQPATSTWPVVVEKMACRDWPSHLTMYVTEGHVYISDGRHTSLGLTPKGGFLFFINLQIPLRYAVGDHFEE